ncbi:hypothetical protein ACQKWADRAFT_261498 [Trichoderma austrokoningii]
MFQGHSGALKRNQAAYFYSLNSSLSSLICVKSTIHPLKKFIMARGMSMTSTFNGYASDYEEKLLNTVWVGIVGLEVLMVLAVAARGLFRRFSPHLKLPSR